MQNSRPIRFENESKSLNKQIKNCHSSQIVAKFSRFDSESNSESNSVLKMDQNPNNFNFNSGYRPIRPRPINLNRNQYLATSSRPQSVEAIRFTQTTNRQNFQTFNYQHYPQAYRQSSSLPPTARSSPATPLLSRHQRDSTPIAPIPPNFRNFGDQWMY